MDIEDVTTSTEIVDMGDVVHVSVYLDEEDGVDIEGRNFTVGGYPFKAVVDDSVTQGNGKKVYRLVHPDDSEGED